MKINNSTIIAIFLIIFTTLGVVLIHFPFSQGDLDKEMPPIITSYDLFCTIDYTKYVYDSEKTHYNPPHRVLGVQNSMVSLPMYYFLFLASFTKLTSLSPYQTTTLVTNIAFLMTILLVFIIIRRCFNWKIGLIASALAAFPTYHWFFQMYIGFMYDKYAFLFVPALLFLILVYFEKKMSSKQEYLAAALMGFFFVSQWLSHYVELFMYLPVYFVLLGYGLWSKKISKKVVISLFIILLVFIPFFLQFYPITKTVHLKAGFIDSVKSRLNLGTISKYPGYWPKPRFGLVLNLLSIAGILFLGSIILSKKLDFNKKIFLIFFLYLLVLGFSNYIGIDANRSGRQLFNGMPFLVILPALGIYAIYIFSAKITNKQLSLIFLILILSAIIFINFPKTFEKLEQIDKGSFVDDEKWQSVTWIRDKTPKDSKIFFLNGFMHNFQMFGERTQFEGTALPFPEGAKFNFDQLCNGKYPDLVAGQWDAGEQIGDEKYIKKRTGLFKFEYVYPFDTPEEKAIFTWNRTMNIKRQVPLKFFDYVVTQHSGDQFSPCVNFFITESVARGHEIIWKNNKMTIIKLNKKVFENV